MNENAAQLKIIVDRVGHCYRACHGVSFLPMGSLAGPPLGLVAELVKRANALVNLLVRSDALPRGSNPCEVLEPELGNLQWALAQFAVEERQPETRPLFLEDEAGTVRK